MSTENISELKRSPLLGIETSGEVCGVAIYFDEKKFAEVILNIKNIHSEKILGIISKTLELCDITLNDLAAIAVSSGPGSFTGLRIGMSVAKGLAFGANLPIIPVPTFEVLALQISKTTNTPGNFAICNKVNNEEIYIGKYSSANSSIEILENVKVIEKINLGEELKDIQEVFGNIKFDDEVKIKKVDVSSPNPVWICRWAYGPYAMSKFGKDLLTFDYDFLEPNYLKNFIVR